MSAPTITVPVTGTDPKSATVEGLEGQLNAGFAQTYTDFEASDVALRDALAALTLAGGVAYYESTVEGLAATSSGDVFYVAVAGVQTLYRNDAGSAVEVVRHVSQADLAALDATVAGYIDTFDDLYLGAKSSAPTVDNDGDPLVAGQLYFDTTLGETRVYSGSSWGSLVPAVAGFMQKSANLADLTDADAALDNLGIASVVMTQTNKTLIAPTLTDPAINLGSDATGDVYYRAADGSFERLPKGTAGQVLKAGATLPEWGDETESSVVAWVNFNGTGTVAIRASKGVSSITDNGTGDYTVNFSTDFADTNYAVVATNETEAGVANGFTGAPAAGKAVGSCVIETITIGGAAFDRAHVNVAFLR